MGSVFIRVVFIYEPHDVPDVRVLKTVRTSRLLAFFGTPYSTDCPNVKVMRVFSKKRDAGLVGLAG